MRSDPFFIFFFKKKKKGSSLLCDLFFPIISWALDPLGIIVVVQNESFRIDFTSTFFESSFALLEVGCVVFGSDYGDEDDEGGYDTDEDTLDLKN